MALTNTQVKAALPRPNRYRLADGGSLYLVVRPTGSKSWEYRYKDGGGKAIRAVVIGTVDDVSISEARIERDRLRDIRRTHADVRVALKAERIKNADADRATIAADAARTADATRKRAQRAAAIPVAAPLGNGVHAPRFDACGITMRVLCDAWVASDPNAWAADTAARVVNDFTNHVYPVIGDYDAAIIEPRDVLALLTGIMAAGHCETARKVKQRLAAVFNWAALAHNLPRNPVSPLAQEFTKRYNAARRATPESSHACVDIPGDVPALLQAMRRYKGTSVTRSLAWVLAYTAVRTDEARSATWSEIDLKAGVWTIPAARMKQVPGGTRSAHVVALSTQAAAVFRALKKETGTLPFVFAHVKKPDRPCSENAVLAMLAELGYFGRMTGHGYRTMFSTLANEAGKTPDVIEACLAHKDPDKIRGTYNRAQWSAMRADLLQWYADTLDAMEKGQA